jgi:membrane peptidoglycan carboxypeptidase
MDVPPTYTSQVYKNGSAPYTVGNAEGVQPGPRTLQMALATSPNTGFVALQEKVGLSNVADMAYRLGMRHSMRDVNESGELLKPDRSNGPAVIDKVKKGNYGGFTLGHTPTSVLELSNVAATIVSGGVYCPPSPIEEIRDRHGNPVPLKEQRCEQAVSQQVADSLAQGMGKDDTEGTSKVAAQAAGWNRPMIGKTGTTQQSKSAGFIGATPQVAGAVLTFADGNRTRPICDGGGDAPPFLCGNGNIYGGKVPARTWFDAMNKIIAGQPVVPLPGGPPPPP